MSKFDINIWKKYFGSIKVKKGVYQSMVFSDTKQILALDNFNNIVNIMTYNIESLLGVKKSKQLYIEVGLEKETMDFNDDPLLYLKCDELKIVDRTIKGMYYKIDKIKPQLRSLSTFTREIKKNKSEFVFRGFLIEIIREGDIYE